MEYEPGDVVLVPFPFRDRHAERARPGVVLSGSTFNQYGDLVIAAITSHTARFETDHALNDWQAAGLKIPSTVRMLLATIAKSRVPHRVGKLHEADWLEVTRRLERVFD